MQICIEELGTNQFKWFDLPVEQSDIDKWVEEEIQPIYDKEKLYGTPEEFEVVDTEDIKYLGSFTSIETYNEYYNLLEDNDPVLIQYAIDGLGYSVEQLIKDTSMIEDITYFECDINDYVEEMLDEGMFGDINDSLRYYIDVDKIASDLVINGDIDEYSYDNKDYIIY